MGQFCITLKNYLHLVVKSIPKEVLLVVLLPLLLPPLAYKSHTGKCKTWHSDDIFHKYLQPGEFLSTFRAFNRRLLRAAICGIFLPSLQVSFIFKRENGGFGGQGYLSYFFLSFTAPSLLKRNTGGSSQQGYQVSSHRKNE